MCPEQPLPGTLLLQIKIPFSILRKSETRSGRFSGRCLLLLAFRR
jgi:hypothetical protein